MSFDMTQFHSMFFEETQEHLGTMETLLIGLDITHPDTEQLNAIFRAAHSIKGSSGTFGFPHLAQITHILEDLLDRIRKNKLALTTQIIDTFLDTNDTLKMLLATHRNNSVADLNEVEAICTRLRQLNNDAPTPQPGNNVAVDNPPTTITPPPIPPATGIWEVNFKLNQSTADALVSIQNLLAEITQNCAATLFECVNDPENANTSICRISLAINADINRVRDLLEFVACSDSIKFQYINSGSNKLNDHTESAHTLPDNTVTTNTTNAITDSGHHSVTDTSPTPDLKQA